MLGINLGLSQKLGDSYADSTKVTDPEKAATDVCIQLSREWK